MKRLAIAILSLALVAILFGSPATSHAAGGAYCWADSYELAIGESTGVYCSGFSPLRILNVYYAEPDGTAGVLDNYKSDANGNVAFGWYNGIKGFYSNQLGVYTVVIQQLGPAKTIEIFGKVEIKNVGTGDPVEGASLSADKTRIDRTTDAMTLTGRGFAPNEVVTVWGQFPTLCSSYTSHSVDGLNGSLLFNHFNFHDISTFYLDDTKADASGAFALTLSFGAAECEGTYRFAARGNTSGLGAYVDVVITGPSVSTNAWLAASKESVGALFDTIEFYADGFGANEILNCWTTSPDGRAVGYGIPSSLSHIQVGADGSGSFSLVTGSAFASKGDPFFPSGGQVPIVSEGSLGVWKMTCKGVVTGATGIAEYTVYGYETAP